MASLDSKHVISTYCWGGVKRSLKALVAGKTSLDFSFLEISGLHFSLSFPVNLVLGCLLCRQALAPWKTYPRWREWQRGVEWMTQDSGSAQSQMIQDQNVGLEKENQGEQIVFLLHPQSDFGSR